VAIGKLEGYFLNDDIKPIIGETLITSGLTDIYPRGLVIGTVTAHEVNKENMLKKVVIKPSVDVSRLKKVSVIK
jgi:rod shape-determining protein MreC